MIFKSHLTSTTVPALRLQDHAAKTQDTCNWKSMEGDISNSMSSSVNSGLGTESQMQ